MWRRDPGYDVEHWRKYGERCAAALQVALDGLPDEPADSRPVTVGGHIFTHIENLEIASNNIALLEGTGSYHNPDWVCAKLAAAEARLAVLMRDIDAEPEGWTRWRLMAQVQGTRKLVRKWREERAFAQMYQRVGECLKAKDEDEANAVYDAWWKWQHRLDRKDFDGPALLDPEADKLEREYREEARVAWAAKKAAEAAAG